MYADDHQIYHSGHDLAEVTSQLRVSADQATKWYESNPQEIPDTEHRHLLALHPYWTRKGLCYWQERRFSV